MDTAVGGCSFMIHVRHAAAAITSGLCETVLITHGESGRSGVGRTCNVVAPNSLAGQFEQPYGPMGPPTLFTISVLRYMKTYGLSHEQLVMVSVVQRESAAKNPRAIFKDPITLVIVSLGLVGFRRAAAPMEAKIRSIGTMQLPHSHRILVGSVLVSRCRMFLRGLATPDLDLIKQVEQECGTATSSDFGVVAVNGTAVGVRGTAHQGPPGDRS
jgi:microcompartment protein CcmK/EutM